MFHIYRAYRAHRLRTALLFAVGVALVGVLVIGSPDSFAQRRPFRTVKGPVKPVGKAKQQAGEKDVIRFGQAVIFGQKDIDLDFGNGVVTLTGPNSTVDMIDPKQPNVKARLQASKIIVYLIREKDKNTGKEVVGKEVHHIEMIGNVRFNGARPTPTGGIQTLRGNGSKGTYLKTEGKLILEGPVTFYGEQPTADGMAKQSVDGKSNKATYDEKEELLKLNGDVKVILVLPGNLEGPTTFYGDEITVEMAKRPYKFQIHSNEPATEPIVIKPSQPPKKKP